MRLIKCATPMVKLETCDNLVEYADGRKAQGWTAADPEDDRYWEQVTYPDGRIQWFLLSAN